METNRVSSSNITAMIKCTDFFIFHLPIIFCNSNCIIYAGFCKENYNSVYKNGRVRLSLQLRGDNTEALKTEQAKEVEDSLKSRLVTLALISVLTAVIVALMCMELKAQRLPNINLVKGIVVQYEFRSDKVNVPDIRNFYDSLRYDEWVKVKEYDKKFATIGYVNFLPAGSKMEILGKDGENSYLRIGSTVYLAPASVYDYITSLVGSD